MNLRHRVSFLLLATLSGFAADKKILLIAGPPSHGPLAHEQNAAALLFKKWLGTVRGVQAGPVLRMLMEKNMIHIVGRQEVIGRPFLYGTTKRFLEHFGLKSLSDLPQVEQLRMP